MKHGANARIGAYPHRDATTPLVIAAERGYHEIVAVIKEAERRRRETNSGGNGVPDPEEMFRALGSGENDRAISLLQSDPSLIQARVLHHRWTPLHVAAARLNFKMVDWLLQRGADVNAKGHNWTEQTPLDSAAHSSDANKSVEFTDVANRLVRAGAEMTPWAAVALGDAGWLRARHAQGSLINPIEGAGGMLRIAASFNRTDILELLLDLGFDPDERARMEDVDADGIVFTWGMPLYHCAQFAKYEMAEILLKRGADPNGNDIAEDYTRNNTYYHKASDSYFTMLRREGKYYQRRYQIDFDGKQVNVIEQQIDYILGSGNHVRSYVHRTALATS
jgi:Ankyrin repeat